MSVWGSRPRDGAPAKLGAAGLDRSADAQVRIVVEKPFGYVRALEEFQESHIFRIDRYLGRRRFTT